MPDYIGESLMALPGIGRSTAGAIMALGAHQQAIPILRWQRQTRS